MHFFQPKTSTGLHSGGLPVKLPDGRCQSPWLARVERWQSAPITDNSLIHPPLHTLLGFRWSSVQDWLLVLLQMVWVSQITMKFTPQFWTLLHKLWTHEMSTNVSNLFVRPQQILCGTWSWFLPYFALLVITCVFMLIHTLVLWTKRAVAQ